MVAFNCPVHQSRDQQYVHNVVACGYISKGRQMTLGGWYAAVFRASAWQVLGTVIFAWRREDSSSDDGKTPPIHSPLLPTRQPLK